MTTQETIASATSLQEEDAYSHVGQELRRMRLAHGLTQAQAAQIIAVSPQQYQKYEDAQSKCSLNYLITLAGHYGVDVSSFLPGGPEPRSPVQLENDVMNEADLLARLVSGFVRLDDATEKLRFVQLVEAIASVQEKDSNA